MTKNPYDVLGVSQNASDDDIKKAYRDLTRKYHPDANVNNPLADLAEEKFKEVQEAYDVIMKEREQGGGYAGYGSGSSSGGYGYGYGGSAGGYQQSSGPQNAEMQAAVNYINSRRYQEAVNLLNRMPQRDAQWYYPVSYTHLVSLQKNIPVLSIRGHGPKKYQAWYSPENGAQLTHREKSDDFSRWVS